MSDESPAISPTVSSATSHVTSETDTASNADPSLIDVSGTQEVAVDPGVMVGVTIGEATYDVPASVAEHMANLTTHSSAPEAYELALPDGVEGLDLSPDNPDTAEVYDILKQGNVNNETAQALAEWVAKRDCAIDETIATETAVAREAGKAELIASLGSEQAVNDLDTWLRGITGGETISTTPAGAKALAEFRRRVGEVSPPRTTNTAPSINNPWAKGVGFNLTEQGRIARSNPGLAQTLRSQANAA